jgi:hypothetical protein
MTIGDVLAAVAAIFALGATWAATLLLVALAFPARVRQIQERLVSSPGACLARGLGIVLLFLIIDVPLSQHPAGPLKLLSYILLAGLGTFAALGSAGIARLVGERIQGVGASMSPFASLTRGTILYVIAGFLPIIGWLFVTPIALLLSLGSAVTVSRRNPSPTEAGEGFRAGGRFPV